MKPIILFLAVFCFSFSGFSQVQTEQNKEEKTFILQPNSNGTYTHIKVPKPNIIIKRGGILNLNKLQGEKVTLVKTKNNTAYIKRSDGGRFFGAFTKLKVNYKKAIETGELAPAPNSIL